MYTLQLFCYLRLRQKCMEEDELANLKIIPSSKEKLQFHKSKRI